MVATSGEDISLTPLPDFNTTQCLTWRDSSSEVTVRCITQSGQPISFCGHGLLGAARFWQDQGESPSQLAMSGETFAYNDDSGIGWICTGGITSTHREPPPWCAAAFGTAPVACAEAGNEAGYLVLEWPENFDLARLTNPGDKLRQHTMRAVIVTCRVSGEGSLAGEDIQLRYFAPQYGVSEDAATGSAMRVLANYWLDRGLGQNLRGLQRSRPGGWLLSQVAGEDVWVGGIARRSEVDR